MMARPDADPVLTLLRSLANGEAASMTVPITVITAGATISGVIARDIDYFRWVEDSLATSLQESLDGHGLSGQQREVYTVFLEAFSSRQISEAEEERRARRTEAEDLLQKQDADDPPNELAELVSEQLGTPGPMLTLQNASISTAGTPKDRLRVEFVRIRAAGVLHGLSARRT